MRQRPWLNYHHLLYFKVIAMEGGIAKAAKKLRLGQPTLSTQMKQFEETIGYVLFDRSKRQLQLTNAGKLVLGYALDIFKLGDEMLDALFDQHASAKLQVQIGVIESVPKNMALKIFHAAQKVYDCVVSISEGHGDKLMRELRSHRVDLVLSNYLPYAADSTEIYARSIAKMQIVICGGTKFAKFKKGFPESLNGQPFILPSLENKLRYDVENYFKLKRINVVVRAEVQDTSLQKLMGVHGDGLIAIPLATVEDLIASNKLSLIGTLPDMYEELWLVAAHRRIQNPIAASIMEHFKI